MAATNDRIAHTPRGEAALPYVLLALAALFWAGNWIIGRAVREDMPPVALAFWRWAPATLLLAPLAWPHLAGKAPVIRRHLGLLTLLGASGVALFTIFVYVGLQTTTTVNAVILNSSVPLFVIPFAWALERERVTRRQILGTAVSFLGILVIVERGDLANIVHLEFHAGDAWVLAAMPMWGLYTALLRRRPASLDGLKLMFVVSALGTLMILPLYLAETAFVRAPQVTLPAAAGILYLATFPSIGAYFCWNAGIGAVGASRGSFTVHLLPAFATVLAVIFLGEEVRPFHAVGIATILLGVWLATSARR
jgi:drug/metabolite transporter (DMT)-like permease